jgi:SAM-dependent methyltransferase
MKPIESRFEAVSKSKTFRNIVESLNLQQKRVLDVGCSFGEYLIHFGPESRGISIDPNEVRYARDKRLDVVLGNVEEDNLAALYGQFDAVFANNIFEHLYSPHRFLIEIAKVLRPDGMIILGVPCIPTLVPLLHLRKFRGSMAGAHINFFTQTTLRYTVERAGWKVQHVRGFRLRSRFADCLLNPIYPHFYALATPDSNFAYDEKRMKELAGYRHFFGGSGKTL